MIQLSAARYLERLDRAEIYHAVGKITKSIGLLFEAHLPGAALGSVCKILRSDAKDHGDFEGSVEADT